MAEMAVRRTVPLTAEEAETLERLRRDGTPQHEAFVKLLGSDSARSEAAALRALIGLALERVGEEVTVRDYERLAESGDEEDEAFHAAMRLRGRDRR